MHGRSDTQPEDFQNLGGSMERVTTSRHSPAMRRSLSVMAMLVGTGARELEEQTEPEQIRTIPAPVRVVSSGRACWAFSK